MPELPINGDNTEIFATTLGIMLYPGLDEDERAKAAAFTSQVLAKPLKSFTKNGGQVSPEFMLELATNSGVHLDDVEKRWRSGSLVGDHILTMATLCMSHPEYASQENAIKIMEDAYSKAKMPGVRSTILNAVKQFSTVAHLWGTLCIRGNFVTETDQTGDWAHRGFMQFLAEAQNLLKMGQEWERPGVKHGKKTMMDAGAWRVPVDWPEYYSLVGKDGILGIQKLVFENEQLKGLTIIPGVKKNLNVQKKLDT